MRGIVAVALAGLVATTLGAPARAGSLTYADHAGDATQVRDNDLPRPSDPELDLLEVDWSTTADELIITTSLGAIGEPVASNGWAVAHYLDYEGIRFEILVQDSGTPTDALFGDGVYLRVAGDSRTEYPCVCRTYSEADTARVTVHVELHSLGTAVRFIDPRIPRPRAGSTFTELETVSYRTVGFLLSADGAAPPPDTTFVV